MVRWLLLFSEGEPFCSQKFCRMIFSWRSWFVSSEGNGCNVCVFTLCCFFAEFVRSLANSCKEIKGRMMKKKDSDSRKVFLWIGFYLQHGILGLPLVLQDSWRFVSIETKLSYEKLIWQRVSLDVWGIVFFFFFCIFDERHVAVVGIELWMSPWVSCLVFGESRRYLHARRERDYAQIDIANFGVT